MKLSSEDLRTFLALAEEKSFTRAAARCNKSQSAFSSRIRAIEDMLGARLFDRTTRNVELTVEGKIFQDSARQLFGEFSDMVNNFRDYAARRKGRVSIAALPSVSSAWLPLVFRRFRDENPGIDLSLSDTLSERCLELVRNGSADIAITSATKNDSDLETAMLGSENFFLVHRRDHPLASLDNVDITDLAGQDFVHLITNSSVRFQVDAALHPQIVRTTLEVRYLATVATMVAAGMGVTVVPGLTLPHFQNLDLTIRPIRIPGFERPIHLVRRRGHRFSVAADAMYRFLLQDRSTFIRLLEAGSAEATAFTSREY
ncbi:MAG: LysR family transcriptional regulator [Rhizobiaceae bacterium]